MEAETFAVAEPQRGVPDNIDIETILNEISTQVAFKAGYDEGQKEAIGVICRAIVATVGKSVKDSLSEIITHAKDFRNKLSAIVPEDKIIEHRIGLDYTTKTPTSLNIISQEYEDKLEEIMNMATDLDLKIFKDTGNACFFWVITNQNLDQGLIDHDFPICL